MLPDRLKAAVPWWAKIALKIALSRLPLGYGFWARANLFRHGTMDDPTAALATWRLYHAEASARAPLPAGFAVLELGPGDSLLASAAAWGFGAGRIVASDIGAFATTTLPMLAGLDQALRASGLRPLPLEGAATAEEVLERIGLEYRPNGLAGLSALPAASFDLIWSNAVLEHVRRDAFAPTIAACARLLRPSGVMLHGIDFRDHLGGALNNLRFSQARGRARCLPMPGSTPTGSRPRRWSLPSRQRGSLWSSSRWSAGGPSRHRGRSSIRRSGTAARRI